MWIRVASNTDTKVVAVGLTDVADKIIGVLEEIGSGSRVDSIFLFSGRVSPESEDVGDTEIFTSLIAPPVRQQLGHLFTNERHLLGGQSRPCPWACWCR